MKNQAQIIACKCIYFDITFLRRPFNASSLWVSQIYHGSRYSNSKEAFLDYINAIYMILSQVTLHSGAP